MPMLDKGVQVISNRMPKIVSPRTHAILDWISVGSFMVASLLFWKRHKSAALGSMICGLTQASAAAMTDYPGGLSPVISFETHLKIDAGFSGLIASMPHVMGFGDEPQAWFFRAKGMEIAAVTGLSERARPTTAGGLPAAA